MNMIDVAQKISNEFIFKVVKVEVMKEPLAVTIHYRDGTSRNAYGKFAADIMNAERMKPITLWSEGYAATGQHMGATLHGTFTAKSLQDAVQQFKDAMPEGHSKNCIDVENLSFWGCRFFDNEKEARKSFG